MEGVQGSEMDVDEEDAVSVKKMLSEIQSARATHEIQ